MIVVATVLIVLTGVVALAVALFCLAKYFRYQSTEKDPANGIYLFLFVSTLLQSIGLFVMAYLL